MDSNYVFQLDDFDWDCIADDSFVNDCFVMMDQTKPLKEPDGFLLVIDEFGKMIYVSESTQDHIGFRSMDLNGLSWFSLLHPDDQVYSRAHLRQAVTRCQQPSPSVPASSPSSPVSRSPPEPTASSTSSFRSSLTVRLLQGNRPRKCQTTVTCKEEERDVTDTRASDSSKSDTTRQDTYQNFHFTGTARSINLNNGSNGWVSSVVWVAVGRPAAANNPDSRSASPSTVSHQENIKPSTSPGHFVLRHDLNGRITYADQRCIYFTGYKPTDLVDQDIFDHIVPEDTRYLVHQFNQLRAGLESIAVVYRFRRHAEGSDTYLNCRAYLTLNPVTFLPDQITSLAAAITDEEGQAEIEKQIIRLAQHESQRKANGKLPQDGQTRLRLTCSAQHNCATAGNDKENCHSESGGHQTKSPLQSPDSNTHPVDISPLSADGHQTGGTPLIDQVAVIDSQYSPSKHPGDEENVTVNYALRPGSPVAPNAGGKQNGAGRHLEKSPGRKNGFGQNNGMSQKNSKASRNNQQKNQDDYFRKAPIHEPNPHLQHFFLPPDNPPENPSKHLNGGRPANTLFHDQLREKHLYLEDSIRNQQNQLQMLHQKLITLANHGAGIYPMQLQLQNPLNKVMDLQSRITRHRDEAIRQRSLVDGRSGPPPPPPPAPPHPSTLQRRNSTPQVPLTRPRQTTPTLARCSSVMAEQIINYGMRSQPDLPSLAELENSRVLSPPFVDMAPEASGQSAGNRDLSVDPLDDLYNSLELHAGDTANLGPDFEEKLRELELLFAPSNFGGNNGTGLPPPPPQSPAGGNGGQENGLSYGKSSSLTVNHGSG